MRWVPQTISGKALAIILPAAILLFSVMTWAAYDGERQRAIRATIEMLDDDRNLAQQRLAQRFDAIAAAERKAANLMLQGMTGPSSGAGAFNTLFPAKGDGTRRSSALLWTGQSGVLSPKGYGAFISATDVPDERRNALMAAYGALRLMAEGLPAGVDNLYFFSPDNDLIIYAPKRADRLEFYRMNAPADFDFQSEEFSAISTLSANPQGVMRCTGLQPNVSDTQRTTWTTGCMTPVRQDANHIGAWGSSIALDAIVPAVSAVNSDSAIAQIIVTADGQLIRHPQYTIQSRAETSSFLDLKNADETSLRGLWQLLDSAKAMAGSGYVPDGDQYYSFTKLSQPDWWVISAVGGTEVRQEALRAARPILIGGTISTAAFALFLIIFFRRQIAAPLNSLADRADSISAYARMDGIDAANPSQDEVARLNRAFDAMETRVARERLRMSQSFDTMLDAIDDYAIILLDPNGKIRRANRAAQENFLWDPRKETGLQQIFDPSDDPEQALRAHLLQVQSEGRLIQSVSRMRGDGRRFWAAETTQSIVGENGRTDGFAYIAHDVSEAKDAENMLVDARDDANRAADMRMNLLATVSHEIRTPMTGILGMLDTMREDDSARTKARSLDLIESSSHAMMRVLDDVLQQARLDSGKITLERRTFLAGDIMRQTARLFTPLAKRTGAQIKTDIASRSTLIGDSARIQQVLANFTSNAVKFTPQGTIILGCREQITETGQAEIAFTVSDNGIGIAPGAKDRLFEKFEQAEASTQAEYGGTGLGLSICRDLARIMGGDVAVESELDQGSTFTLTVTLDVEEPDIAEQPGVGQTALAITPVATSRISAEAALESLGFTTICASQLTDLGPEHHEFSVILFDDAYFRPSQITARFLDGQAIPLSTFAAENADTMFLTVNADILRRLIHKARNA
ncbi:PAS domain-containing sensor histidine kinase [Pontixanthobacter sp.]|uniref:PAS domain-containing sensor histidine kinase n=1 Tax=Pontixanthobacter sp. TaxID=2792078 RepID=UPI003C7C62F3